MQESAGDSTGFEQVNHIPGICSKFSVRNVSLSVCRTSHKAMVFLLNPVDGGHLMGTKACPHTGGPCVLHLKGLITSLARLSRPAFGHALSSVSENRSTTGRCY
jgi:hypothetical protein